MVLMLLISGSHFGDMAILKQVGQVSSRIKVKNMDFGDIRTRFKLHNMTGFIKSL